MKLIWYQWRIFDIFTIFFPFLKLIAIHQHLVCSGVNRPCCVWCLIWPMRSLLKTAVIGWKECVDTAKVFLFQVKSLKDEEEIKNQHLKKANLQLKIIPEEIPSQSQGHLKTDETNNHSCSQEKTQAWTSTSSTCKFFTEKLHVGQEFSV